jgi:hypothetical protein
MKAKWRALLLAAIFPGLVFGAARSGRALQALCVDCSTSAKCEYVTRSRHSRCTDIAGGCVAAGECTLSLRITP